MVDTSGTESGCRPLHFAAQLVLAPVANPPASNSSVTSLHDHFQNILN